MACARLLLVQAGACDQILAVDDERRVELHRVAQTGGIVERTDLQMILVVKADDLPAVAYCVLILLLLAFRKPYTVPPVPLPSKSAKPEALMPRMAS